MDGRGKLIMECILETKASSILEFIRGLHGSLSVAFEEGTSAAWLHDLLKPHVTIWWSAIPEPIQSLSPSALFQQALAMSLIDPL